MSASWVEVVEVTQTFRMSASQTHCVPFAIVIHWRHVCIAVTHGTFDSGQIVSRLQEINGRNIESSFAFHDVIAHQK